MSKIKLPEPLRNIIHNAFFGKYDIKEAYVDEMAYKNLKGNNLKGLRNLLDVSQDEIICDCLCKLVIHGKGEFTFLFEDKKSKHTGRFKDAITQLELTHKLCEEKNIGVDFAVICRVSVEPPFKTRKEGSPIPPFKVVYVRMSGLPHFIHNSTKIPLLKS